MTDDAGRMAAGIAAIREAAARTAHTEIGTGTHPPPEYTAQRGGSSRSLVLSVRCPKCHAAPRSPCQATVRRVMAGFHPQREAAAGVTVGVADPALDP